MSSRKFDITEAYIQALQALQENENLTKLNKVFESKLDEKFTVDTFNNKYKPQEKINVNADGSVSAGNFILKGSGITKRVGAILSDNKLRIDNENIHIDFDGNDIKVYGPYWFTSDFEDNGEFKTKVTKAVKDLYNDMKKLQQPAEKKSESKSLYESNNDEFYNIETEIDTDSVERNDNIISGSGTINYYKTQEDLDNKEPSSYETFTFEYDVDDNNNTLYIYDTRYAGDVDEEKIKDYIKHEVIPNTDDGSTVSLLAVAYRDIPEVGVEDWGKGNELYFCLDTKKLLSYLEDYEVEIPKYLVDNDDEPVDTYLSDYLGINLDDGEFDNSYNWGSRLTHDLEIETYTSIEDDTFYVKLSVHREGDVRGNYTTDFLLRFDDKENFYVIMSDAQLSCANTFEFEGKKFWVEPHIFDECVDISIEGEDNDWTDVYCEDLDQLKEIISGNSEE